MEYTDEIVFEIIKLIYPDWIGKQKERYTGLSEYEQYVEVIRDVFQFDIERACTETDHALDYTELERKLKIMKLNSELKAQKRKKKEKEK